MGTDRGSKKREILEASLDLFSMQGFDATSMAQIADAVGIRKASLYSHFQNKQEILDTLVQDVLVQYEKHSIFAEQAWKSDADADVDAGADSEKKESRVLDAEAACQIIQEQLRFILHDPKISRARKMLTIEQFRNPELAKLLTKQNYGDVMHYFTGMMEYLIRQGAVAGEEPEIMAAQLCLPVSTWISLCDREPEREPEVMDLIERHIRQFFRRYEPERLPGETVR